MAGLNHVPWTREEVAQISLFRPSQGDVRNEIQRRLINTMMQAEGALKVYTQLLNNLPISSIAKSQLIAQYHVANIGAFAITSAFSIFKQMVDTVIGENGNTSTIGMFLDAMDNAGWGLGRDSIIAINWGEIEGLHLLR